ncbi:gelsolin [Harmonia axyridis]|uniref:gelsolin n=1 Tax=Harmonia axyridis TaxID=115357 RepID=UPI001E278192|nr:gelsolin [Harmonia axyridis]
MKQVYPEFEKAGQEEGIEIWRVEDFKPVAYPKDQYGKFYEGDSYIILRTKIRKSGAKEWDLHFWLGSKTSQDEAGAAAILAVHLDDALGGVPIQYREVQEHESQLFVSNFKSGIRYLPGGVASGFHHVDPDAFETRLFQVKGSRNVRVKQVDPKITSMNEGDCFILDVGKDIYVYIGTKSKRIERLKAITAANQIRDQDHAGKAHVHIIDEFSSENDVEAFFKNLGSGSRAEVRPESAGGDDLQFESNQQRVATLYRVSDSTGDLKVAPVGEKPFSQSTLDTNDCFILDTVDSNIFVWIGKKCNSNEKTNAMKIAESYLNTKSYPPWVNVQRIVEEAEPTAFTQYFKTWQGQRQIRGRLVRDASTEEAEGWEARLLHASIRGNTNQFCVEQIFDFEQDDLNPDDIMILDVGTKVYIWIGEGASVQEKSKCEDLVTDYLKKFGRENIPRIRVQQGNEDEKFRKQFPAWNDNLWDNDTKYDDIKAHLVAINKAIAMH